MIGNMKSLVQAFGITLEKIPEICYAGNPVLRSQTSPVTLEEGIEIGKIMEGTLSSYRSISGVGRGLAAPQIGIGKSVFITFIDDAFEIFINPKIVEKSNKTNFYRELCISVGILSADVERANWIIMEWLDKQGISRREKFDGFKARLYQHEEAHLRGRLNLDDASPGGIDFITFDPLKEQLRDKR